MSDRILTLHPEPLKQGVNIDLDKYKKIKTAILEAVSEASEVRFMDLTTEVNRRIGGKFKGSLSWYVTTVKLDLEARNEIERVPDKKPQYLRKPNQ